MGLFSTFKEKAKEAVKKVKSIFSKPVSKPVAKPAIYTPPPKSVSAPSIYTQSPKSVSAPTKSYTPTSSMPEVSIKTVSQKAPSMPSKGSRPSIQTTFTPASAPQFEAVSPTVAVDTRTGAKMSMDTSLLTKGPTVKSSKEPTLKTQAQFVDFSRGVKEGVDTSQFKGLNITGSKNLVSSMVPVDYKAELPRIKKAKVKTVYKQQPPLSGVDVASFLASTPVGISAKPTWMTDVQWQAYTASGKNVLRTVEPPSAYKILRARRIGGGTIATLGRKTEVSREKVEQYLGPTKSAILPTGFTPKRKFAADVIYGRTLKQKPADIWKKIW